jgi:hypothetical protein
MDHSTKVWLQLAQWFLRRRLKCEMLTDGRKVTTIAYLALVGRTKITFKSSPLKPLNQIKPNLAGVGPFQNCVRQHRPVSKMATITKNRNFFKWPTLPECAQI